VTVAPKTLPPKISIRKAAAAAIVTAANLPAPLCDQIDTSKKFVVHPYTAPVERDNPLLMGYLRSIYQGQQPVPTPYPAAAAFSQLTTAADVARATPSLAASLAESMSRKNANPGILFGFLLDLDDGTHAHGVIKADLDDEQRFHFVTEEDGAWTLSAVQDILPSLTQSSSSLPSPGAPQPRESVTSPTPLWQLITSSKPWTWSSRAPKAHRPQSPKLL
jgi:hypothetical protein